MKKMLFVFAGFGLLAVLTFYYFQDSDFKPKFRLSDNSYMENVVITQKKAGQTRLVVNAQKAIFESETDVKLLTVIPARSVPAADVTIVTPVTQWRMVMRRALESKTMMVRCWLEPQSCGCYFWVLTSWC